MNVAIIGHNSFIARALARRNMPGWRFYGHKDWAAALDADCVINCAFNPALRDSEADELNCLDTQIAAKAHGHFVMISSRAVYGTAENAVWTEDAPINPQTPYARNKAAAEKRVQSLSPRVTILRAGNIFGTEPGRRSFMGMAQDSLHARGEVVLDMHPAVMRDFLPVDNAAALIAVVAAAPRAGIFNLGAGFGTACGDMAAWLIEGYGSGRVVPGTVQRDGFILTMDKFYGVWPDAPRVRVDDIKEACIAAGREIVGF